MKSAAYGGVCTMGQRGFEGVGGKTHGPNVSSIAYDLGELEQVT